jgi:hypothetical protein
VCADRFSRAGKLIAEGTATELKRRANAETLDDAFIKLTGEELDKEETPKGEAEAAEVFEEV